MIKVQPTIRKEFVAIALSLALVLGLTHFLPTTVETKLEIAKYSVLIAILVLLYFYFRSQQEYISFDGKTLTYKKGWFFTEEISIPIEKIQEIRIVRDPLAVVLGLATIMVDTAGTSEVEVEEDRLDYGEAQELVKAVTQARGTKSKRGRKRGT